MEANWEILLKETTERALRYLAGLNERSVTPSPEAIARLEQLVEPFPAGPTDPVETIRLLDEIGSPNTTASAGGRYFGFVVGGSLPAALAANWLAGAWDQESGQAIAAPIAAALESICADWLRGILGLPPDCGVGFVTGATMANFSALAAARHALLKREGWDVEAQGLIGAPPITVIVGDQVHVSVLKALGLVGLGRQRVTRVPVDDQGRILPAALPAIQGPTIVCIQAGNVNTGAFDPAKEICVHAHAAEAWVHVDGAFGLWATASPQKAQLVSGFGEADSWATDAHKWLNVPYDSGLVFVRNANHLRAPMTVGADYLLKSGRREPDEHVPEFSRRARGVEIWAALRSLGRTGLADLVERCCSHARRFAEGLTDAGFTIFNEVVLNQVLVSFGDDETTRRVIARIQREGVCWCGSTVWRGRAAMRISVSSWATTKKDVEQSLAAMIKAATEKSK